MATFPCLKTGAVMQYPAECATQFRTEVLRFVDGSEQRYRDGKAPLRQWVIRLDLLDEIELMALEWFFSTMEGQFGTFTFLDPQDGATYPKCSFGADSFEFQMSAEGRGATALIVRQERD